jgi:hypothetical protein
MDNPNNDPAEVKNKTEDEIKQDQENLWDTITGEAKEDITKMVIKQDCLEIFTLDIVFKKSNNMYLKIILIY